MSQMDYSQETKDLARLASKRVIDAMISVLQLCEGEDQSMQVAIMGAGAGMGIATGSISAKYGCTHDEAKNVLLDLYFKPSTTTERNEG